MIPFMECVLAAIRELASRLVDPQLIEEAIAGAKTFLAFLGIT